MDSESIKKKQERTTATADFDKNEKMFFKKRLTESAFFEMNDKMLFSFMNK